MNEHIKRLAEQAEFVFWEDEPWGPGPGHIAWAPDYSKEFSKFVELLIRDCADTVENLKFSPEGPSDEVRYQRVLAARALLEKYGLAGKSPIGVK
jgi:hypothetical protein